MDEPPTKKQKKEKKAKKEKKEEKEEPAAPAEVDYETRCKACGPISSPLANKKLTKKLHKLVKKASGVKGIRRGVKEVVKALRKNEKGLCIIAGDISPIDVIAHVPILCEEAQMPYVYVPSKEELSKLILAFHEKDMRMKITEVLKGICTQRCVVSETKATVN